MDDKKQLLLVEDNQDSFFNSAENKKYPEIQKGRSFWTSILLLLGCILICISLYFETTKYYVEYGNHIDEKRLAQKPCIPKKFNGSDNILVCVCNATYCDEFPPLGQLGTGQAAIYTTSISGKRFEPTTGKFTRQQTHAQIQITIDTSKLFQKIIGFGGAFTDAAGVNWDRLSPQARQHLINAYFGKEGIGYTVGRVPIAGCDFSTREYSYNDVENDFNLTNFKLEMEDFKYKIPMIKAAQHHIGSKLKLFSSPWGPPGWLKTNGFMHGSGTLKDPVGGKYYQTWANYFVRFFEEYAKQNITFWGLTVQNEPNIGNARYAEMNFTAEMERDFVKMNLGPAIRKNLLTQNLKIMIQDTSRDVMPDFPHTILKDQLANKFVDGVGIHWYADGSSEQGPWKLDLVHKKFPKKFLFYTEACTGCCGYGVSIGDWSRGEQYMHNIIEDLNHWVTGWTDWNLCLDEHGGPNWVQNYVDCPIVINNTVDEFYKQPMYYALGHISKFITPGSIRAKLSIRGDSMEPLEGVAFVTPENYHVLVLNNRDKLDNYIVSIKDSNMDGQLELILENRSFTTIVWNKPN